MKFLKLCKHALRSDDVDMSGFILIFDAIFMTVIFIILLLKSTGLL
ncbi:MAG: hypothetical protein PQ975_01845 [Methanobacterium sp.]|jgi:hypothetical protein